MEDATPVHAVGGAGEGDQRGEERCWRRIQEASDEVGGPPEEAHCDPTDNRGQERAEECGRVRDHRPETAGLDQRLDRFLADEEEPTDRTEAGRADVGSEAHPPGPANDHDRRRNRRDGNDDRRLCGEVVVSEVAVTSVTQCRQRRGERAGREIRELMGDQRNQGAERKEREGDGEPPASRWHGEECRANCPLPVGNAAV